MALATTRLQVRAVLFSSADFQNQRSVCCDNLANEEIREYAPFDVATCFNVLDRCDRPRELLQQVITTTNVSFLSLFLVL